MPFLILGNKKNAMNTSSIEITDKEYCIKLSREAFDLSLIRQLIKRIQAEELFFKKSYEEDDSDIISKAHESHFDENFDRLCDK
ncbi:hypothetical protein [Pedobacter montanisoli]|uniref:Uncharacterized protein n=1 Tax=Pedobacter montanisoli TaxID=2923277 RepID=A0ABS9ZXN9_9SPHI|nr:hypothetical protein [Pedobacter montanisoli]MCJ0743094.1 hypothetical protein [Pedobacter montanisoli]